MSVPERDFYQEEEQSIGQSLLNKTRKSPFLIGGILVCAATVAWGALNYKKRGSMSLSQYIMHYRVYAQGGAIGCLTVGMIVNMIQILGSKKEKENK